jgi:hypothetical protein
MRCPSGRKTCTARGHTAPHLLTKPRLSGQCPVSWSFQHLVGAAFELDGSTTRPARCHARHGSLHGVVWAGEIIRLLARSSHLPRHRCWCSRHCCPSADWRRILHGPSRSCHGWSRLSSLAAGDPELTRRQPRLYIPFPSPSGPSSAASPEDTLHTSLAGHTSSGSARRSPPPASSESPCSCQRLSTSVRKSIRRPARTSLSHSPKA